MCQVVVSKLGTMLFYSTIHFKPLKCVTNRGRSEWAHSTKDKRILLLGTCQKVPLVYLLIDNIQDVILSRSQCSGKRREVGAICKRLIFLRPHFEQAKRTLDSSLT